MLFPRDLGPGLTASAVFVVAFCFLHFVGSFRPLTTKWRMKKSVDDGARAIPNYSNEPFSNEQI